MWGDDPAQGAGWANLLDQTKVKQFGPSIRGFSWDDGHVFTSPVGAFKANAWGLYDMQGNAVEFCEDWYGEDYYKNSPAADPTGPATGDFRVARGSCWRSWPDMGRVAGRGFVGTYVRNNEFGFRVVLSNAPKTP